jgi:hypothetical protein
MKAFITVLVSILLTIFFMRFTSAHMVYFDIGINNGVRTWDINVIQTPAVIASQIVVVLFFDKIVSRKKGQWRTLLNILALVVTVCAVFAFFAMTTYYVPREGGFLRFLGYYFFGLEPGRLPIGDW